MRHYLTGVWAPDETQTYLLKPEGNFPNNPQLPAVHFKHAFQVANQEEVASFLERLVAENKWGSSWRNGIYDYHHFHSTAHEALLCYSGVAVLQVGGPSGVTMNFNAGDILLLPAGTAHRCVKSTADFHCIGCYPEGQEYDIQKGNPEALKQCILNIQNVPLPLADPVYGKEGPLIFHWKIRNR